MFGSDLRFFPGGKGANQAVAAARAGAAAVMLGNVGDDRFAADLIGFLDEMHVDTAAVRAVSGASTGVALIIVDADADNSIVVVPGANARLEPADAERVTFERDDVAVAQLEIPLDTVAATLAHARAAGATTVLNPAPAQPLPRELDDLADVLVVNEIGARRDGCDRRHVRVERRRAAFGHRAPRARGRPGHGRHARRGVAHSGAPATA